MDYCPVELHQRIFELACTDGGATGRSLSLVSRHVHKASRRFQYQSLAVLGLKRIERLLNTLSHVDVARIRIKHLYVSDVADLGTSPRETWSMSRTRPKERDDILSRLLAISAPHLKILHMNLYYRRSYLLVPVALPALTQLSIRGTYHHVADTLTDTLPPFLHLTRLHLGGSHNMRMVRSGSLTEDRMWLSAQITRLAPALAHLRVSNQCTDVFHWDSMLGLTTADHPSFSPISSPPSSPPVPFLTNLSHVLMDIGPPPSPGLISNVARRAYHVTRLGAARKLAHRDAQKRRVIIVDPPLEFRDDQEAVDATAHHESWLDCAEGGGGCWDVERLKVQLLKFEVYDNPRGRARYFPELMYHGAIERIV